MDNIIGLKELRQNVSGFAKQIQKGRSFIVVKQSKPLFKITPIKEDIEQWEEAIDFTKIKKGGVLLDELLTRL
jgi:antitoxin (DNA-binding transcriptional repressor) of toxin-antitoxin stability system